ncbi:MAG: hypothetical protein WC822_06720 [Candidatus Paceibacterota bacterium]|jgi:hypothetical protein
MTVRTPDIPGAGPTWKYVAGTLLTIILVIVGYLAASVNSRVTSTECTMQDTVKRVTQTEQSVAVIQTDMRYMRVGIDDIKTMLREHREESKP